MSDNVIRLLGWTLILGGIATLTLVGYSFFIGEVEVSSRMHGTSIIYLAKSPGPFYSFLLVYLFSGLLMMGMAYYQKKPLRPVSRVRVACSFLAAKKAV